MTETATIKLVQATKEDMMQLKENVALGDGKYKRVMEPRYGQVFKLKSMITGKFDDKFYIISSSTNNNDITEWLKYKMIWIPQEELSTKLEEELIK